jgi:hypothetical protein
MLKLGNLTEMCHQYMKSVWFIVIINCSKRWIYFEVTAVYCGTSLNVHMLSSDSDKIWQQSVYIASRVQHWAASVCRQ